MGQGLMLQQKGVHVAFLGGTAILIFIDLVAHLIRKALGVLDEDEKEMLDEDKFKLILYISSRSPEELLAYSLLERF